MRERFRSVFRRDFALTVGVLSGLLVFVVGGVGYLDPSAFSRENSYFVGAAFSVTSNLRSGSLWYHTSALVLPSFVVALSGTALVRRRVGLGRRQSITYLGGTLLTLHLMVLVVYVGSATLFGALMGIAMIPKNPVNGLFGAAFYMLVALLVGGFAMLYTLPIVSIGVGVGSAGGHLVARGAFYVADRI